MSPPDPDEPMEGAPLDVAVFASGGGSNFQALVDHSAAGGCWRVALLVSNHECGAVERAQAARIPAAVIPTRDREPSEVAREMLTALERHDVSMVLLAGYLRLLPTEVVHRFRGRMLNIHPALLPEFGGPGMFGINVHRAVVDAGSAETGATVHWVDEEYDRGAILAQARVPVEPGDGPEDVAARVLRVEHRLYAKAVDHLCMALREGRPVEPLGVVPTDDLMRDDSSRAADDVGRSPSPTISEEKR